MRKAQTSEKKAEMAALEEPILYGKDLYADESIAKHAEWVEKFRGNYTFTKENTAEILRAEIGKTFVCVLEDAGVYKCTDEGRKAFLRFIEAVNA